MRGRIDGNGEGREFAGEMKGLESAVSSPRLTQKTDSRLTSQILHQSLIPSDILNSNLGIRELASQIILGSKRSKQRVERRRERRSRVEEGLDGVSEHFGVFEDLFGSGFDGGEFAVVVVEFGVAGFCEVRRKE